MISVVIPTLNEVKHLPGLLRTLHAEAVPLETLCRQAGKIRNSAMKICRSAGK